MKLSEENKDYMRGFINNWGTMNSGNMGDLFAYIERTQPSPVEWRQESVGGPEDEVCYQCRTPIEFEEGSTVSKCRHYIRGMDKWPRKAWQPAPVSPQDDSTLEVVDKMCLAAMKFTCDVSLRPEHWKEIMTAALAVVRAEFDQQLQQKLDEALAPIAEGEHYRTCSRCGTDAINNLLASRRARLGRKKEPSLQEHVCAKLRKQLHADVNTPQIEYLSAEIIALVRAEKEPRQ